MSRTRGLSLMATFGGANRNSLDTGSRLMCSCKLTLTIAVDVICVHIFNQKMFIRSIIYTKTNP